MENMSKTNGILSIFQIDAWYDGECWYWNDRNKWWIITVPNGLLDAEDSVLNEFIMNFLEFKGFTLTGCTFDWYAENSCEIRMAGTDEPVFSIEIGDVNE